MFTLSTVIYSTVYLSTAVDHWEPHRLTELLAQSRVRNAALDVTGLLVWRDDVFMQVLEGDEQVVRPLYRKIAVDPRHRDVVNIWVAYAPQRRFPDWSMGFRNLSEEPLDVPGYRDLLVKPLDLRRLGRRDLVEELLTHVEPEPSTS